MGAPSTRTSIRSYRLLWRFKVLINIVGFLVVLLGAYSYLYKPLPLPFNLLLWASLVVLALLMVLLVTWRRLMDEAVRYATDGAGGHSKAR